jgi:hypothetical protein
MQNTTTGFVNIEYFIEGAMLNKIFLQQFTLFIGFLILEGVSLFEAHSVKPVLEAQHRPILSLT